MLDDKTLKLFTELIEIKKKLIKKMEKDEDWDLETTLLNIALPEYENFTVQIALKYMQDNLKHNLENENIYKEYVELSKQHRELIEKDISGFKEEMLKMLQKIL